MYRLTNQFQHLSEEIQHDLWIMVRTLQEAPLERGQTYSTQRETGDQMMKKYFEPDVGERSK